MQQWHHLKKQHPGYILFFRMGDFYEFFYNDASEMAKELDLIRIKHNIDSKSMKNKIKKEFWNGNYFYDDLNKKKYVAGDANIFPFWLGVFDDNKMLKSCIKSMQNEGLAKPFPLKYTKKDSAKTNFARWFVKNYEGNALWMHMGPLYVQLVKKIDKKKAKDYIDAYTLLIEKHKNFLEVFNPDGSVFRSPFYHADEGMLWAANFLTL